MLCPREISTMPSQSRLYVFARTTMCLRKDYSVCAANHRETKDMKREPEGAKGSKVDQRRPKGAEQSHREPQGAKESQKEPTGTK